MTAALETVAKMATAATEAGSAIDALRGIADGLQRGLGEQGVTITAETLVAVLIGAQLQASLSGKSSDLNNHLSCALALIATDLLEGRTA